jgi:CLIP-associating protein 1/2
LATLATLLPFFHLLTIHSPNGSATPHDAAVLRQALAALLPSGGLVDRLGDNREKARENARQALVVLGGVVFSHSGLGASAAQSLKGKESMKGPEPPMAILERFLRELGLASKVWRVREQVFARVLVIPTPTLTYTHKTIVTLVHLRRAHPSFPIRPYLPQLVDGLEDSDGTVRDCARNSIIEIFTAPGVTDAARADLKKEMTKKNVRKTIVDAVLGKLMAAGSAANTDVGSPPPTSATNDSDSTKPPMLSRMTTLSTTSSTAATARAVASTSTGSTEPPAGQVDAAASDVPIVFVSNNAFRYH